MDAMQDTRARLSSKPAAQLVPPFLLLIALVAAATVAMGVAVAAAWRCWQRRAHALVKTVDEEDAAVGPGTVHGPAARVAHAPVAGAERAAATRDLEHDNVLDL